jgi:hypothetical protein
VNDQNDTDQDGTGQDDSQDDNEITFDNLASWPKLDVHAAQVFKEAGLDEAARARFAHSTEERDAHLERAKQFEERADAIDANGELDPPDLDLLKDTGRGEGATLAAEIERRESEAAAERVEQARIAAMSDDEKTAEEDAKRIAEEQARHEAEWSQWAESQIEEGTFRSVLDLSREYEATPGHRLDKFWAERNDIERRALAQLDIVPPTRLEWLIEEMK